VPQHGEHLLVHPVLDPEVNRVAAWLACPYERAAHSRLDVLAVGLAMTEPLVRSWLTGQRARADRDTVVREHLLSEIISGRDSVGRDVIEGVVSLGWRLQDWHVGIHLVSGAPGTRSERGAVVFRPAVEHADELGVARLLATWQRSEVTRAFAEVALSPLRDAAHLLTTLRAYLESGGSVVLTAEALGVHRNTVTARVHQVRERLGVDLDDPSQRLALQVACRTLGV
jgi:hypothetical protein